MRWIGGTWSQADIVGYNLREGGEEFTVFEDAQPERVRKARELIDKILEVRGGERSHILELGCSAGDISGHFSEAHEVIGVDVVPGAVRAARERYPSMIVLEQEIEQYDDADTDIVVLCEILEHVADPLALAQTWLPRAEYAVIGHPLVGGGTDPEHGHVWAYDDADYLAWFAMGGHELQEAWRFEMAGYQMVIGWSKRL